MGSRDNLKWSIRMCLTVPPAATGLLPIGHPGVFRVRDKILMFFHLTRTNMPPPSPGIEPLSVVVPIVYDIETNQTSIPQKDQININNPVMIGAQQILVNLANSGNLNMQQCTIMPCVREILLNLTLPNEGPQGLQGPQGPPNAAMMHQGMTRPPMPGPPHMTPQMGGSPMGGPPMRPGMINPAMMPQQRMMGIPGQPGPQHQGPQGPQGGPAGSQPPRGYMG